MSDLLTALREAGQVDSKGYFTLDARRAREKMQEFLLTDNHEYTLNLVAAGVAMKASAIRIDTPRGRLDVTLQDVTLPREFLEQPFSGLFIATDRVDLEGYRELSIGLNAALALKPKHLELHCGNLLVDVSADPIEVQEVAETVAGTRISVHEKSSLTTMVSHLVHRGPPHELSCVEQRAGWGPPPVHVNGVEVVQKFGDAVGMTTFTGAVCSGAIWGSNPSDDESTVEVIKNGVRICTWRVKLQSPQGHLIVHAPQLLKNVSGTDIVEDDGRWQQVLGELQRHASDALLQRLCEAFPTNVADPVLRRLLLQAAVSRISLHTWWRESNPKVRWLGSLPLFTLVGGETICVGELMDRVRHDNVVLYVQYRVPLPPMPREKAIVAVSEHWELHAVRSIFAGKERLAEREIDLAMRRQQNLQRAKIADAKLDASHYLIVVPFDQNGYRGELGLVGSGALDGLSRVTCVRQRRRIAERQRPLPLPIDAIVESDAFEPNFTFDDLDQDAGLAGALLVLEDVYFEACRQVASQVDVPPVKLAVRVAVEEWVRLRRDRRHLPIELQRFPLFPTLADRLASVADLAQDLEEFGKVAFVEGVAPGAQKDHRQLVLENDPKQRPTARLLRGLFADRVVDYTRPLLKERKAMLNQQRPLEQATLDGRAVCPVRFEEGAFTGSVGLSLEVAPTENRGLHQVPRSVVRFLKEGHVLARIRMTLPVGPLEAAVESPTFTPNETWDDVVVDAAYEAGRDAVQNAIDKLAWQVAESFATTAGQRQMQAETFLLDYLAWRGPDAHPATFEVALFPTITHRRLTWHQVREAFPKRWRYLAVAPPTLPPSWRDGPHVLLLEAGARSVALRALFGDVRGDDAEPNLQADLAHERFMEQATQPHRLRRLDHDVWLGPLGGDLQGQLAVCAPGETLEKGTQVIVLHQGRPLDRLLISTPVPGRAVVEAPQLTPLHRYDGVKQDQAWRDVSRRIADTVVTWLREVAEGPIALHGGLAHTILMYAVGEASNVPAVVDAASPLAWAFRALVLEDSTGQPVSLAELAAQYLQAKKLPWVGRGVQGEPLDGLRVVCADSIEQSLLKWLFKGMVDYRKTLQEDAVIRANRARERVTSLRLPQDNAWLACTLLDGGMEGELGVAPPQTKPGITLVVDGNPIQSLALFNNLPIIGIATSPRFEVNRRWDEVKLAAADRKALDAALDRLFADLATRQAPPSLFFDYLLCCRERLLAGESLPAADLPLFVSPSDEPLTLQTLLAWYHRDRLFWMTIAPGPAEGNAVRTRGGQDPVFRFLSRFFVHAVRTVNPQGEKKSTMSVTTELKQVVKWGEQQLDHMIEARAQAAQQAARIERENRPKPQPAVKEKPKRVRSAAETRASEQERQGHHLLVSLQECFTALIGRNDFYLSNEAIRRVRVVATGDLVSCVDREIRINHTHAVARKIEARLPHDRAAIAYLASAVYSILNQTQEKITDRDERRFLEALAQWVARQ